MLKNLPRRVSKKKLASRSRPKTTRIPTRIPTPTLPLIAPNARNTRRTIVKKAKIARTIPRTNVSTGSSVRPRPRPRPRPRNISSSTSTSTSTSKYLIYKATGGLAHMLGGLTIAISDANAHKRKLIIDCKNHPAFKSEFSKWFYIKGFNDYSEDYNLIPEDLTYNGIPVKQLEHLLPEYRHGKYYIKNINIKNRDHNFNDKVVVFASQSNNSDGILNIKVISSVKSEVQQLIPPQTPYVSVHFRNTDIKNNIDKFVNNIKTLCGQKNIKHVYIATDDANAFDVFVKKLPTLNIVRSTIPQNCGGNNIHYHSDDKELLVKNCLIDIYMILKSNYFIPSINSGFSIWICKMIKHRNNIFDINSFCNISIINNSNSKPKHPNRVSRFRKISAPNKKLPPRKK